MLSYLIEIEDENHTSTCIAETGRALGLAPSGITWEDKFSSVFIESSNNELKIVKNAESRSEIHPILERNGRTLELRDDKAIPLLPKDSVLLGKQRFQIRNVFYTLSDKVSRVVKDLHGSSASRMIATAAILLAFCSGCKNTSEIDVEPMAGDVDVSSPLEECMAPQPTREEMEKCCQALENETDKQFCLEHLSHVFLSDEKAGENPADTDGSQPQIEKVSEPQPVPADEPTGKMAVDENPADTEESQPQIQKVPDPKPVPANKPTGAIVEIPAAANESQPQIEKVPEPKPVPADRPMGKVAVKPTAPDEAQPQIKKVPDPTPVPDLPPMGMPVPPKPENRI